MKHVKTLLAMMLILAMALSMPDISAFALSDDEVSTDEAVDEPEVLDIPEFMDIPVATNDLDGMEKPEAAVPEEAEEAEPEEQNWEDEFIQADVFEEEDIVEQGSGEDLSDSETAAEESQFYVSAANVADTFERANAVSGAQELERSMAIYSEKRNIYAGEKNRLTFEVFDENISESDILSFDWFVEDTDIAEFETTPSADSWTAVVVGKKDGQTKAGATVTYSFLGDVRSKQISCNICVGEYISSFILEVGNHRLPINGVTTVSLMARDATTISTIDGITWEITDTSIADFVSTPGFKDQTVQVKGLEEGDISIFARIVYNGGIVESYGTKLFIRKFDKGSWIQQGTRWAYQFDDGSWAYGWQRIQGNWYYFGNYGWMQTGWLQSNGKWYYLGSSGSMQTGWQKINNKWYYFESSGAMVIGWQQISGKWYYFNSSGVMQTGWQKINNKWYYFENSGAMAVGWKQISGKWYYFESSGAMVIGWKQISGKWYYFEGSGAMATGWKQLSGKWYYLDSSGAMLANTSRKIGSKTYNFDSNGVCTNP